MKVVIYSQQGENTLSGIHSDIIVEFSPLYPMAFVVKMQDNKICHYVSCQNIDAIGIWKANELDKRRFISACKMGKLAFMIVPDTDEERLYDILQQCITSMK
ncbi:hypothetical protein CQA53_04740 [Helicobacter didelphidarum]|uniref:Uncharacterized protein n=1 Tax=Helicobacter didelphidarum TaxID=2040648 RepID=A0A3D8IM76_9HELI|nr:hypothetical protein [Helicobacter didelphidarum]RDU66110.1 hypothetical protein CQA53_04740 [Helicobacter didelphidarum]